MIVKLAIKPGWHIYANPTGVAEVNPSQLELDPESRNILTMGKPVYPAGVLKVLASSGTEKVALYEKVVEIRAGCQISSDAKPGPVTIKFRLSYQACNDSLCRCRRRLKFPFPWPSAAKKPPRKGSDEQEIMTIERRKVLRWARTIGLCVGILLLVSAVFVIPVWIPLWPRSLSAA